MATAVLERQYLNSFYEEDDEPLSDDELEQLAVAYKEFAAGEFSEWEDVKLRLAALP